VTDLVGQRWRQYSSKILDPIQANQIQRQETRRAFYAGASALMTIILENMSSGDEVQESDLTMMDSLKAELDNFVAAVSSGRA
jgi:hypothetical protein